MLLQKLQSESMSSSETNQSPSCCQVYKANKRCLIAFIIGYLACVGIYYIALDRSSFYLSLVAYFIVICVAIISLKYRDRTANTRYKSCVLLIALICDIIAVLAAILYYKNQRDIFALYILCGSYVMAFISGVYGIYYSKQIVVNLQPDFNLTKITIDSDDEIVKV